MGNYKLNTFEYFQTSRWWFDFKMSFLPTQKLIFPAKLTSVYRLKIFCNKFSKESILSMHLHTPIVWKDGEFLLNKLNCTGMWQWGCEGCLRSSNWAAEQKR